MVTDIIKTQIIGQFDRYDFKECSDSKHKIWFKNLTLTPKDEEQEYITYIGEAFVKQNDAIHLIGELTYEDKVIFDSEILLNPENEYEIINPVSIKKF